MATLRMLISLMLSIILLIGGGWLASQVSSGEFFSSGHDPEDRPSQARGVA